MCEFQTSAGKSAGRKRPKGWPGHRASGLSRPVEVLGPRGIRLGKELIETDPAATIRGQPGSEALDGICSASPDNPGRLRCLGCPHTAQAVSFKHPGSGRPDHRA